MDRISQDMGWWLGREDLLDWKWLRRKSGRLEVRSYTTCLVHCLRRNRQKGWHTAGDGEEDVGSMSWAEADGGVRVLTVRGIARVFATEGHISAVAAAMFYRDQASVSM